VDNLWISFPPGPAGLQDAETPNSPYIYFPVLCGFVSTGFTHRARPAYLQDPCKILWLFSGIFYCPGVDFQHLLRYITRKDWEEREN